MGPAPRTRGCDREVNPAESRTARPLLTAKAMTQTSKQESKDLPVHQENQRVAQRHDDVVRLLSSDELAEASDFYDRVPCTD